MAAKQTPATTRAERLYTNSPLRCCVCFGASTTMGLRGGGWQSPSLTNPVQIDPEVSVREVGGSGSKVCFDRSGAIRGHGIPEFNAAGATGWGLTAWPIRWADIMARIETPRAHSNAGTAAVQRWPARNQRHCLSSGDSAGPMHYEITSPEGA